MPVFGNEIFESKKSLQELAWESARTHKYEDETAIIDASSGGKSITYMELHDRSRKCAAYMQSLGIGKDDFVTICADGCLEFVCVMYAIMTTGAAVAPCNPAHRKDEMLQQFSITRPKLVFVSEYALETMKSVKNGVNFLETIIVIGTSTEFITLDQILNNDDLGPLVEIAVDVENDIAIVPQSSGTTGLPKCVAMTHRNYTATLGRRLLVDRDPSQTFYVDRPMYHTGGFMFVLGNVATGLKTVIEKVASISKFFENIEKYKISIAVCVPPTLIAMANTSIHDNYDLSSLKVLIGGGAALALDIIKRVMTKYGVTFCPAYGMTETGAISVGAIAPGKAVDLSGTINRNIDLKIADVATEQECEDGCDGEIRVRGAQITKGYLRNPEANATAFDSDGWFRTGDLGHVDEHGRLVIVDRLKEVIKYNTIQVSPAELESVIIRHPKVDDVGVVGIADENCGQLPRALVVRNDPALTVEDIHEIVNENLLEHKHLRGGVQFVESIPRSELGKIQRNVLETMTGLR